MTESKDIQVITKRDFNSFIDNIIKDEEYDTVGVKSKDDKYVFGPLEDYNELKLDYDVTILPPKKYFLPQIEKLMDFNLNKQFEVKDNIEEKPRIIIGMHPYDIIAIEQMDKVYLDSQKDDFYKKRRDNSIIIGTDIQKVTDRSFAFSMGTNTTDSGFDLMITDIGNKYAIIIGSKKGEDLLKKYAETRKARNSEIKKINKTREFIASQYKQNIKIKKEDWSSILVANYDNTIWEEKSNKCLECSSCTMVCPTCYCYDVKDDVLLDLKEGSRYRTWDGCLLHDFTKVGSGETFRNDIRDRYRHRFYRKGNYLAERYGFVACVGCGRCATACIPDIADPCNLINELSNFNKSEETDKFFIKKDLKMDEKGIIHIPRKATIKNIKKLTETETFFEIELDDKKPLGHSPGQFVEVSIFGIGEAPISITSSPNKSSTFELVVRKVGNVTTKLISMKVGDKIGIRGPFGTGFNIKELEGKNLLFVAGGLGLPPMRSLINYVVDKKNRDKFKEITILYGCKQPCEVMFLDEVNKWEKEKNVECKLTVDQCEKDECWIGEVGLITTLFPKINFNKSASKNTVAIVVGPPIMYKFVIKCLKDLEFPDENILVSLERRMKCGVGKCGHCQINGVYVCKEGPVFKYSQIKELPEAFE